MRSFLPIVEECVPLRTGRWLLALSGGGDSVALLRLLMEAGLGERLVVGYFNHGWSEWGGRAEAFVVAAAAEFRLPMVTGKGQGGKTATNAEATARLLRYGWFAHVCAKEKLDGVIVAHTRTDVVESFLMRAGKGSGLQGLTGMAADSVVEGVRVLRPLLGVSRAELRTYLNDLGQTWLEDPDNEAGGSQRARIRKLLPLLAEAGVTEEGVAGCVASLADANAAVEALVDMVWDGHAAVERRVLVEASAEVAVRVLGRLVAAHGEGGMLVRRGKRMALWQRICAEEKGAATLGGAKFVWNVLAVQVERE